MQNEPIQAVEDGLRMVHSAVQNDGIASECAHISVITFENTATQVEELKAVDDFQPPKLSAGGGTSFGAALRKVVECAESEVRRTEGGEKDYKPCVYMMTDGAPTDSDWKSALPKFKNYPWNYVVACAAGQQADTTSLLEITDKVIVLANATADSMAKFFNFVSTTTTTGSHKGDGANQVIQDAYDALPPAMKP